jgi:hypothetical protein
MAYHYVEKGHSPMVVGALYSKYGYAFLYRLKRYNKATGICRIQSAYTSGSMWVLESELSNWNLVRME